MSSALPRKNMPKNGDVAGCRGIIMAGLAGALDPTLHDGEVVIDQPLVDTLQDARWRRGGIHTSDHLIATPAAKAALFESTGATVVDMETAKARAFAERAGVPFSRDPGCQRSRRSAARPSDRKLGYPRGRVACWQGRGDASAPAGDGAGADAAAPAVESGDA
jgi:hypothetical protein